MEEYIPLQLREDNDCVVLPREEYNALIRARMGIELIGSTLTNYGGDDRVVVAVCKQFGYEYNEEKADA